MKLVSSKSVQVKEIEAVEQQKKAKLASYQVDAMLSPCHAERKSRSSKVSFRPSSLGNPSEEELQVQVFATSSNNQPSNSHLERFRSRIRILSSGSFSSSDQGSPGKIGFSLATSSRILTRAKNWRSKGIQAKNERRERRATKTLAIVLGKMNFQLGNTIKYVINLGLDSIDSIFWKILPQKFLIFRLLSNLLDSLLLL